MLPSNLQPLVDGDVIRYEIGYGSETGWRAITEDVEAIPPFRYVEELLLSRLEEIQTACQTDKRPVLYLTIGRTFRYDIATRKGYKENRIEKKPWHFANLTAYMTHMLDARIITEIEADDAMAMDHVSSNGTTILCSRDKDLKQVPGWFYSWELGRQGSFGPVEIDKAGYLILSPDRKKLTGTGLSFFYSQLLTGDTVDNIPGLPKTGPVNAFAMLNGKTPEEQLATVCEAYKGVYGETWEKELTEQGRLCWLLRNPDQVWEIGITD